MKKEIIKKAHAKCMELDEESKKVFMGKLFEALTNDERWQCEIDRPKLWAIIAIHEAVETGVITDECDNHKALDILSQYLSL